VGQIEFKEIQCLDGGNIVFWLCFIIHHETPKVIRKVQNVINSGDDDSIKQIPKRRKVSIQNDNAQLSLFDGIDSFV